MFGKKSLLVMAAVLVAGCAKEREYEKIFIENQNAHLSKSAVMEMCGDIKDPCLYVPSVANTPYNVTASRPYWLGEEKIVVSRITDSELKFVQIENDSEFQDNINNFSPVFSLKIDHIDYKCKEDDYGDCTNAEEENEDITWDKKRFVKVDLNEIDIEETNSLPIDLSSLFKAGCFTATNQEVTKFETDKVSINMTVKKTYSSQASCVPLNDLDDLRYLSFTVDYKYSIVKLSALSDPNYTSVDYPLKDKNTFGFFDTTLESRTVDNHGTLMGTRKNLLNRWSPNKSKITYFLNDEFYRPGMERILQATEQAIASVNKSLEKAEASIQIELQNGSKKDIGDIRNNFIILVKDPQASGVIGYGPSVVNPSTGEILNARTVMYFGTIKKFISRAYDELVEKVIIDASNNEISVAENDKLDSSEESSIILNNLNMGESKLSNQLAQVDSYEIQSLVDSVTRHQFGMDTILDQTQTTGELSIEKANEFEKKIAEMSEQTFFHSSNMNFSDIVSQELKDKLSKNEKLKFWDQLTEAERKHYLDLLVPYVWVPTLVHEFGHNLGLRHNFSGSHDKENFYTEEEHHEHGLTQASSYSSIMDYAYKTINELPIMGKYDVAALKFAYARKVEMKDGTEVALKTSLNDLINASEEQLPLKSYGFCTDENVGNDPLCNRFDEGTNYEEVVTHYVNAYEKNYSKSNFRGRRYSYEGRTGDFNYAISTLQNFLNIRNFFEIYDQRFFNGSYNGNWQENKNLVDIKKAADKSFDFFMNILETPAYHCIEVDSAQGRITGIKPFGEMAKGTKMGDQFGITFDIRFGCLFLNQYGREGKMYLEFGKYFNNSLDLTIARDQIEQGDTSQIDVRGHWMDKALASNIISARFTSPTTIGAASAGNYLDHEEYRERLLKYTNSLLTNHFETEVIATTIQGQAFKVPVTIGLDEGQFINKSYNRIINGFFGLEDGQTSFKGSFMKLFKSNLRRSLNSGNIDTDSDFYDYFNVSKISPRANIDDYNFDTVVEFKNSRGRVTHRFGAYNYNTKAKELALLKDSVDKLDLADQSQIIQSVMFEDTPEDQLPSGIDDKVKALIKIPTSVKVDYVQGRLGQEVLLRSFLALAQ